MTEDYQKTLKSLKKNLRKQEEQKKALKPVKKFEPKILDFAELMKDVKRIESDTVILQPDRKPIRVKPDVEEVEYHYFYVGESYLEAPKSHSKNGQGNRDIQKLLEYNFPIVSNLDLHGVKLEGVDELLTEFCYYIQSKGVCGRIIHGSGLGSKNSTPVLKNKVRAWLAEYPEVLAFTEEKNNDGSVLILLKRKGYF